MVIVNKTEKLTNEKMFQLPPPLTSSSTGWDCIALDTDTEFLQISSDSTEIVMYSYNGKRFLTPTTRCKSPLQFYPCRVEFVFRKHNDTFAFSIISQPWKDKGIWNSSPLKTMTRFTLHN